MNQERQSTGVKSIPHSLTGKRCTARFSEVHGAQPGEQVCLGKWCYLSQEEQWKYHLSDVIRNDSNLLNTAPQFGCVICWCPPVFAKAQGRWHLLLAQNSWKLDYGFLHNNSRTQGLIASELADGFFKLTYYPGLWVRRNWVKDSSRWL